MGNLCFKHTTNQVVECIQQLQQVEKTLELMIVKYETQVKEQQGQARRKLHRKNDCMRHVKTIHIIRSHKKKLEDRLTACINKRYHLESLNVTKMHIDALKTTTKTFNTFLKDNQLETVEKLQEALTDMIEDACEINETLARETTEIVDETDLEEEYQQLCAEIQLPEVPSSKFPEIDMADSEDEKTPLAAASKNAILI
jgi:hypothetical protein